MTTTTATSTPRGLSRLDTIVGFIVIAGLLALVYGESRLR